MFDWLTTSWESTTQFFSGIHYSVVGVWTLTATLMIVGLVGSVVPLLPGPLLILVAGIVHTLLLPEAGMSWQGITLLGVLLVVAYAVDVAAGAMGARWFGASRWGIAGALIGGLVGLFFVPLGFILGPLIGALAAEIFFAKKRIQPAVKSTWGTLLGTGVGLVLRLIISIAMIATVLIDALWW